jgi:hypothetical protein
MRLCSIFAVPRWLLWAASLVLLHAGSALGGDARDEVHHRLRIALEPEAGRITVVDRLSLPVAWGTRLRFQLASTLEVEAEGAALDSPLLARDGVKTYGLTLPRPGAAVVLRYAGPIRAGARHAEHGMPEAALGPEGSYLDGASAWLPRFGQALASFEMEVTGLPDGWEAVSQGRRGGVAGGVHWTEPAPQDDVYLVAGPFHRYADAAGRVDAEVYLREADEALARRYLDAVRRYLDLYETLLGPYPYAKFAVVENRWETGYGMPSFTLLGSRVLRLPFILDSSLPHELLHNWWGNGVLVDARDGNWSEGLTAYLADYLLQEARGRGAEYRRGALQRYESFAAEQRDAPLRAFRARHDDASQAIGYGKALMLFHALRRELGDAAFLDGLRAFAAGRMHRGATFGDLLADLGRASGRDLGPERAQWLERAGAPELRIAKVATSPVGDGRHRLDLTLAQTQAEAPFRIAVPVAITLRGRPQADLHTVRFEGGREATLAVEFDAEPLRIDVDPAFDTFRRLAPGEVPPSLGTAAGAARQVLVVPGGADAAAWQAFAAQWARRYGNVEVVRDRDLKALPSTGAVWVLGWDNRFADQAAQRLAADALDPPAGKAAPAGRSLRREADAVVLVAPDAEPMPLAFVGAEGEAVIAALARKLPHYGRYGRLAFDLRSGENTWKDERPGNGSALTRVLVAGDVARAGLPPEPVLAPPVGAASTPPIVP